MHIRATPLRTQEPKHVPNKAGTRMNKVTHKWGTPSNHTRTVQVKSTKQVSGKAAKTVFCGEWMPFNSSRCWMHVWNGGTKKQLERRDVCTMRKVSRQHPVAGAEHLDPQKPFASKGGTGRICIPGEWPLQHLPHCPERQPRECRLKMKALGNQLHSTLGMYFFRNQKTTVLTKRNKESQID